MHQRLSGLLALALALTLSAVAPAGAATGPGHQPATPGHRAAEQALARAQALFGVPVTARGGGSTDVPGLAGRDATMVLRDLAATRSALDPADRRAADRLLARPTSAAAPDAAQGVGPGTTASSCDPTPDPDIPHFCLHWSTDAGDPDAPPLADADNDGLPDWVETTGATLEHVWQQEVGAFGYRAPLDDTAPSPDAENPNGLLDVYLADLGANPGGAIYGYCTTDQDDLRVAHVPAYCVLDDDFDPDQFRATALESLRVTAAHEFFHAIQFGYDWLEDFWFMESTAAWIEDEVYDSINDNRQYLRAGPLHRSGIPMDYFAPDYPQYGSWIFWRYLAERFGATGNGDRSVVQDAWNLADNGAGRPGMYSLQATRAMLRDRGLTFSRAFNDFGTVNRFPQRFYSEGRAYPRASLTRTERLTKGQPTTGRHRMRTPHLTTVHVRYKAAASLAGHRRLRVVLDLPRLTHGSAASLAVHLRDGSITIRRFTLDRNGDGRRTVPFTRSKVRNVELTISNASTRYDCGPRSTSTNGLSCNGDPIDDTFRGTLKAVAVR